MGSHHIVRKRSAKRLREQPPRPGAPRHVVTVAQCNKLLRTTCERHQRTNAQSRPLLYAPLEQRRALFEKLKAEMLEADKGDSKVGLRDVAKEP